MSSWLEDIFKVNTWTFV